MEGILAVVTALSALADPGTNVYYGRVDGATKPAECVAATVFDKIPEYQEIKKRGLKQDDPEYWTLLTKANEKFYKAVKKVAEENKHDVVVEKGSHKFDGDPPPDITQKVIDALEK